MSRALLLSCEGLGKTYGTQPLFCDLSFALYEGDRVGLVGPNGSGKTTLLRILAGVDAPDAGTRSQRRFLRLGYVPQDPVVPADRSIEAALADAVPPERRETVETSSRVAALLGRAGFADPSRPAAALSAGWRKRLAIARGLAAAPDLLLLDEPTNHLDVEGILWLEGLLRDEVASYVVVSHDRYFLEHVASRMLELNRVYPDGLFEAEGRYTDYLVRRDEALRGQAAYRETLANKVRREVEWLRRGPKARTRKSRARIKAAGQLIEELEAMRARTTGGVAGIGFTASGRQSKQLLVTRDLSKTVGGRPVCAGLSLALTPGMRVGVVGPSGSGKSTLLNLLAGRIQPDAGEIERADGVRVVQFDQEREGLDPAVSLRRALAPDADAVVYRDRSVHVVSWAKRFLFRPEQLETAVGRLSGGERARILIARLMLQPADVLILDEPTNDLDIPTLEVLEETLAEFPGGLVLVTRDRYLLERVATVVLALDGAGGATFYADYAQWEAARGGNGPRDTTGEGAPAGPTARAETPARPPVGPDVRRLTYLEKKEWEQMEPAILDAEAALAVARRAVDDPAVAANPVVLQERWAALQEAQAAVDRLYERWAQLDRKQR